jgi:hypothetical protein
MHDKLAPKINALLRILGFIWENGTEAYESARAWPTATSQTMCH